MLGLVLLLGTCIHRFLFLILLALVMLLDGALFAADYYQMSLPMIFDSAQYLTNLDVTGSITYFALFVIFVASWLATYHITQ